MIRSLTADDSDIYFALRGKIARSPLARFYSDSVEREAALDIQGKKDWCTESDAHCIRGTIEDGQLLTITMLTRQGGPGSPLVELEAAYVDERLRGTGKGRAAYEDALQIAEQKGYRYIIGFVRDEFTPAHHLCSHLGFVHAYTISAEKWADGSICDTKAYVMCLNGKTAEERRANTLVHIDNILQHAQACLHAPELDPQRQALRHLEQTYDALLVPPAPHVQPSSPSMSAERPGVDHVRQSARVRHG
jgi:GNAT superfamily N-acetyltransferase